MDKKSEDRVKEIINSKQEIKLDLGCNTRKHEGYIGMDMFPCKGVDIVIDFEKEKLPFKNESVTDILMYHTIEHLANAESFMFELCRVLKVGGTVRIRAPFYSCVSAHDLGHKCFINPFTMGYWTKGGSTSPDNPGYLSHIEKPNLSPLNGLQTSLTKCMCLALLIYSQPMK
jgi:hypothetical protein